MSTAQLNRTATQINADLALARSAVQPATLTNYATAAQGAKADTAIQGNGSILTTVSLTQAQYDALPSKVSTTLYIITDA